MSERSDTDVSQLRAEGYVLSSDPALLDFTLIHDFLTRSYWSPGISSERVRLAAKNSITFGIYWAQGDTPGQTLVAYGRVLTDYVSLAYLLDVFVLPQHRGKGLASWLTRTALAHPDLVQVRSWMLATSDAHGLYAKHGFQLLEAGKHMNVRNDEFISEIIF